MARIALKEVLGALRLVWTLALLALLEVWSRLLGWYDFAVRQERHVVWDMAWSQKADVAAEKDASVRQDHHRSAPQTTNAAATL